MRLTVPPVRLKLPSAAWVNVPPRFTVALVAVIVPALLHALLLLPRLSVEPAPAVMVAPAALLHYP